MYTSIDKGASGWNGAPTTYRKQVRRLSLVAAALLAAQLSSAYAQDSEFAASAFSECPSQAFLTQGKVPQTFGINLVTGHYSIETQDHGVNRVINGLGFNENDRYLYGWSYEHGQPARIHNDWSVEPLGDINVTNQNYFVGDVSATDNTYYVYRRGQNYGLFAISLDPDDSDYLTMRRVVDGTTLNLRIADFAVNPVDDQLYAVEFNGSLHRIDRSSGTATELADVGVAGTFGAAYFDNEGNMYIGRNNDGSIFRIPVSAGDFNAELFASGPASNSNDGSRCASAPLSTTVEANIDFGDAPDSYATSLDNNGARHGLLDDSGLFFGSSVDGESDAYIYPLTDDDTGNGDDEDGIQMISDVVERENAIAMITTSAPGFLNAWIDLHRDGQFDPIDQVATSVPLGAGQQAVYMAIPDGVSPGDTWARFRLSTTPTLEPFGGAPDGEVQDMQVRLAENEVTIIEYPSASGWTTIAFEDNWPLLDDYDLNDLVVYMRTTSHKRAEGLVQVDILGEIAAVGAGYHNGFGIRLPGVLATDIDPEKTRFKINGQPVTDRPLVEEGREEAILIISGDVFDYVGAGNHCLFYRTEPGCGSSIQLYFDVSVAFNNPVDTDASGAFDPFLFAAEGAWHGAHFVEAPGRSYEIHLKNQAPTEAFNMALFSQAGQDVSNPEMGQYFLGETGLPWAVEIATRWTYPLEYTDVSNAYPLFPEFARSAGANGELWYEVDNGIEDRLFTE